MSTLVSRLRRVSAKAAGEQHDAPDLVLAVRHRVDRPPLALLLAGLLALPEVHAAGQLADDQQVDALEQLRPERRGRDECRMDLDRSQVGEQPETAAQREERLLRPDRRRRIRPLRATDRAEQDRVGRATVSTSSGRIATP